MKINKVINDMGLYLNLEPGLYELACGNSGIGKSYYSSLFVDLANKMGYKAKHVKSSYLDSLYNFIKDGIKFDLIILDEMEYYPNNFDLDKIVSSSDIVILIDRLNKNSLITDKTLGLFEDKRGVYIDEL